MTTHSHKPKRSPMAPIIGLLISATALGYFIKTLDKPPAPKVVTVEVPVYVNKIVYLPGPPSNIAIGATFNEFHKIEWMLGFIANLIAQKETAEDCKIVPITPVLPQAKPAEWKHVDPQHKTIHCDPQHKCRK